MRPCYRVAMPSARSKTLWCLGQAAFIAALTYGMSVPPEGNPAPINPAQVMVSFGVAVIMAAFFTALLTRLWDRAHLHLKGASVLAGATVGTAGAEHHQTVEDRDRVGARLGVREIRKTPSSLWRGQQRG